MKLSWLALLVLLAGFLLDALFVWRHPFQRDLGNFLFLLIPYGICSVGIVLAGKSRLALWVSLLSTLVVIGSGVKLANLSVNDPMGDLVWGGIQFMVSIVGVIPSLVVFAVSHRIRHNP